MDNRPFRILGKTENSLDIDLNHPLATFPIQLTATIRDVFDANQQKGGRCNDIAEIATTNGPGMQTLLASRSSDFFQGMPFSRKIEDDDAIFYASVETKTPVDQVAIEQLSQCYAKYLNNNMKILDLMSGPDSYLPENIASLDVTGLGLKESDLKANSALNHYVIHELNCTPVLPFDKLSTAQSTSGNASRDYRYGYGYLDSNLNYKVDPGEKKIYFEISGYATPYIFYDSPL